MILGAHVFISEGIANAPKVGRDLGCDAIQIFTKNNNQWQGKPISTEAATAFQKNRATHRIQSAFAHSSYLINLGSPKPDTYQKSLAAMHDEMHRATTLGLAYLIFHPGAHLGSGEAAALHQISKSVREVLSAFPKSPVQILFEIAAGQGTCVGHTFEHLATLLEQVGEPKRTGICFDTCHTFAAGYPLQTEAEYAAMFREFDRTIGLKFIKAFHLNDSKKERGSRVDRHEHIGQGKIGLPFFKMLMNDARFQNVPMALETPKGKEQQEDLMNLKVLRQLIKKRKLPLNN